MTRVERCGLSRAQAQTCKHFCLVEAQRSFHKTPRSETYQRWRDEAPADFEFTLKAWQLITHKPTSLTYRKAKLQVDRSERCRSRARPRVDVLTEWRSDVAAGGQ